MARSQHKQIALATRPAGSCAAVGSLATLLAMLSAAPLFAQTISRRNQILEQRGLQIQATAIGALNTTTFAQSNFTGVTELFNDAASIASFGHSPGITWGIVSQTAVLDSSQTSYQHNLVSFQYDDEKDISDPTFLNAATTALATARHLYPQALGFTNQYGGQQTSAQMKAYMSVAQPDMLMFDDYAFTGNLAGGSPTSLYQHLQQYRLLGLAGNDGTGNLPIPTGTWLQSYTSGNMHVVSPSEIRLDQFAAWTFGYKFATTYIYQVPPFGPSALFTGTDDSTPRQPQFSAMAETNRESRNLGPALVRMETTTVGMIPGQHMSSGHAVSNALPSGVPQWSTGADNNPYLTGVSASNVGTVNNGLRGDVLIGDFKPLEGANGFYFMVTNGLTAPTGTVTDAAQQIHLTFNFGTTGIHNLERLSRLTGQVEIVPLVSDGGSLYHLDLILDGGTGDLFKYSDGSPFFTALIPGDLNGDRQVDLGDYAVLKSQWLQTSSGLLADLNGDGAVDISDFAVFKQDYLTVNGGAGADLLVPVPEPSFLTFLASSLIACASATRLPMCIRVLT